MQIKPDKPNLTRHARLFELLRQENVALDLRAKQSVPKSADGTTAQAFRKIAERSFFQGRATL